MWPGTFRKEKKWLTKGKKTMMTTNSKAGALRLPRRRTATYFAVAAASLALAAAGCSSSTSHAAVKASSNAQTSTKMGTASGGTLMAQTAGAGPWSEVFNPFSPSYVNNFSFGAIYEPLFVVNPKTEGLSPWLATAYKWGDGGDKLVLTVRKGVKWSNGQPLTAADVAFTFNLQKKTTQEAGGVSQLVSARAKGQTVTLVYNASQYVNLDSIALNTPIVPPFTFDVANPLKFEDNHPIGTGPFVLSSWSSQYIIYKKNPNYWRKGEPHINEVEDIAADSNSTMEAELIAHKVSLSGVFTSDLFKTFVDRDKSQNLVYTPPSGVVVLAPNLSDPVFKSTALRLAIDYALNRKQLDDIGESGAEPPASQSGLAGGLTQPLILKQYKAPLDQDLPKARSILKSAGYKLSGGKLTAAGSSSQVSFSIEFPSSYSDWLTDCSLIQSQLSSIGIKVNCDGVSYQTFSADEGDGHFQATLYGSSGAGPTAYEEYYNLFWVAPTGLPALGKPNDYVNIERYDNPSAVSALKKLETTNPNDTAAEKAQLDVMEKIMANDVPVIPLFDSTYHEDFVNGPLYGWPSTKDPYNCTCNDYWEPVLLHAHTK